MESACSPAGGKSAGRPQVGVAGELPEVVREEYAVHDIGGMHIQSSQVFVNDM